MKRVRKVLVVSVLVLVLLRGPVFRFMVSYYSIGKRPTVEVTNTKLIAEIDAASRDKDLDVEEVVAIADEVTSSTLRFSKGRVSNNPNELIENGNANCIGYAAMFNSVVNHLIQKHGLQDEIAAEHHIGQLYCFGVNLHPLFDSPFFADHDFNRVIYKKSGETLWIDPSLSDYSGISRVTGKR